MGLAVAGAVAWLKTLNTNLVTLNRNLLTLIEEQRAGNQLLARQIEIQRVGAEEEAPTEPPVVPMGWTQVQEGDVVFAFKGVNKGSDGEVRYVGLSGITVGGPSGSATPLDYGDFQIVRRRS